MRSWLISARGKLAGVPAVAQDDDAVGAVLDFAQPVGDVDDADALLAQFADELEQALGLGEREAGRRLVHDDDAGVERKRLGDLDHLLLGEGKLVEPRAAGDVEAEPLEQRFGVGVDLLAVDQLERRDQRLAAEKDVGRHVEVVEDVEFLVDEGDAELHRVGDVVDLDRLAVHENLARRPADRRRRGFS